MIIMIIIIIKIIIINRIMRGRDPPRFCRLRHTLPLLRVSNADPQRPAYRFNSAQKEPL